MGSGVKGTVSSLIDKLSFSKSKEAPAQPPNEDELKELKASYEKAEQDHVFHYYDQLNNSEKAQLFEQLSNIDPEHVNELAKEALQPPKSDSEDAKPTLEPLPESASASILDSSSEDIESWHQFGLQLVADNKVAVVLMAGGQGTRLGSSDPKGCYNIGLPSEKSLFQLQAERIVKIQKLAAHNFGKDQAVVPWYVMTSGPTRKPTEDFFEKHKYFGLDKENVVFFEQGVLPCISNEGKIIMEGKGRVAVAPDGNGGIYRAMLLSSVLRDMEKRGVEHIHAYCVDNCLVRVADPVFIGLAATKSVSIATKVVRKRAANEPVGLILSKNGKPDVVEYSEIDSDMAEATDPKNSKLLKFRAANIVNHYYSFSFLQSIPEWAHKLPHHVARKKIPYIDLSNDQQVKPEKPNGVKLEQFVFDCFPLLDMEKFACLEVKREDEFSPLKNAPNTGEDDPGTSRQHIMDQGRRWVEAAGATVTSDTQEDSGIEVSPLISYSGEGLQFLNERTLKAPAVIERDEK